ncbi:hypothetical protein, partial [Salmonella enterica]
GYTVSTTTNGKVLKKIKQVKAGDTTAQRRRRKSLKC